MDILIFGIKNCTIKLPKYVMVCQVPTHFISSSRDFPLIEFETSTQREQHSTDTRDALLSNDPLIT